MSTTRHALAVLALVAGLAACQPGDQPAPASTTTTTTTDRCEEDQPCWPCSPDDNACNRRL